MQGHLGREFQGPGYQKHDLEGAVQALRGYMRKTCLDKGHRGSKDMVLLSWCCTNDCPRNFLMSLNDPKELHTKIKVYTSPKQTPIDLFLIQRNSITSIPQNIIQEIGDTPFL